MSLYTEARERLRALLFRARQERELDEEVRVHLAMESEANRRKGLDHGETRRQAAISFGAAERFKEEVREARGLGLAGDLARELRYATRRLAREPAFSVAAVATLALGVGGATAIFSLVHAVLLAPLPYPQADRLVRLTHVAGGAGGATVDLSDAIVMLYQEAARGFAGVAAWRFDDGDLGPSEPGQTAVRVRGARVTASFFDVLGVPPALGRGFAPGEDRPGALRVVVLSQRTWRERLDGDPDVLGRQIDVNDVPRTIVGVMPPRFADPAPHVELWLPLALDPARTRPARLNLVGIGRLEPGVSAEAARADLARVLERLEEPLLADAAAAPWREMRIAPQVQSLRDSIVGPSSQRLWLVFGSVLLVLLVACTNVAALLLVRAESAQGELAARVALGSGFRGVLALVLSESVLLSALGGGAGMSLAVASTSVVRSAGAALSLPRLEDVGVDAPVLLFALGTTVFCALFVGAFPLLRARRISLTQVLRRGGPAEGRAPRQARQALVVAQVALAVVLVTLSTLMTRSLLRLYAVDPGFDASRVVTARVLLPYATYGVEARLAFFAELARRARAVPGVRAVALTDRVPLAGDGVEMAIEVEDRLARGDGGSEHAVAHVDGAYFRALRIPLLRGRTFGAQEGRRPVDEAIVSRAFAERSWPGASPLGRRVRPAGGRWYTVVGEAGNVRDEGLEEPPGETVYLPIVVAAPEEDHVSLPPALSVVVRTEAGEGETLSAIRGIVAALDPTVPTYDEAFLEQLVHEASARTRALTVLLAIASVATLLLGAVGLYGITAYSVSIRRRELGIRMALGAQPADVRRMVAAYGLRLAGIGIAIGTACALATAQSLRGLLYGVSPTDPVTLGATPAALLAVALVASWIPARRAAAVDPAESLRSP